MALSAEQREVNIGTEVNIIESYNEQIPDYVLYAQFDNKISAENVSYFGISCNVRDRAKQHEMTKFKKADATESVEPGFIKEMKTLYNRKIDTC